MNWNQATATGHTLMLPLWQGYFKWDWNSKKNRRLKKRTYGLTNKWQKDLA